MSGRNPVSSCSTSCSCGRENCSCPKACAVTSQNQGLPSAGVGGNSTIRHRGPIYARGPTPVLASYAVPVLQLGQPSGRVTDFFGAGMNDPAPPQSPNEVNVVRAAGEVNVVRAAGSVQVVPAAGAVNIVRAAGQTAPAPVQTTSAPPPTPTQVQQYPAKPGDTAAPQQGGLAIDAQTAQALAGLGSTLLQGTRDIVVAAITQGAETDRERTRQQAATQIADLQNRGLLSQQEAANAMSNVNTALQAPAPVQAPPPAPAPAPGFFASMTTGQKVAVGVGAAALVGALGFAVYKATR